MKITKQEIYNVASLARLNINEENVMLITNQVGSILEYMDKLNEIDTSDILATSHAIEQKNAFRDDIVKPSMEINMALENAPAKEENCFIVPKILG